MSFSIGPYMGKRDAVIKAVEQQTGSGDTSQLEAAKAFLVAELKLCPATLVCTVQGWGHHHEGHGHNVTLAVNQLITSSVQTPILVE